MRISHTLIFFYEAIEGNSFGEPLSWAPRLFFDYEA